MVRLEVGEPDWVLELGLKNHLRVVVDLLQDENIQVVYDIVHFLPNYTVQLSLNLRPEVVQTIDEASDIPLQGPAPSRGMDELCQVVEGELPDELADVYHVVVVDQGVQDLEECAVVGQLGTHLYQSALIVVLVLVLVH